MQLCLWLLLAVAALRREEPAQPVSEPVEPVEPVEPAKNQDIDVVHHEKISSEPAHTEEPPPTEHHEGGEPEKEEGEEGGAIAPNLEEGEAHHAGEHASHPAVCILLYTSILLGPALVLFANSKDETLRTGTYRLIEAFITIFIAVQYFQAFDELMSVGEFEEHHQVLAAVCHLIFLFVVATLVSWSIKSSPGRLGVFTACGAHYVAFSACHTSGKLQTHYFTDLEQQPLYFLVLFLGLAAIAVMMHFFRAALKMSKNEKFEESVDDLENDVIALAIGYSVAHTLDYVLSGQIEHFGQKTMPDEPDSLLQVGHTHHSPRAIGLMFFAAVLFATMSIVIPKAKERDFWAKAKAIRISKGAGVMIAAFTFLIATEWCFHEAFPQDNESIKLYRDLIFAVTCTVIALAAIYLMSLLKIHHFSDAGRTVPLAVGLAAAFAWEECFDKSVEILSEEFHVIPGAGNDAPVIKILLAVFSPVFLLPMYVLHVKPKLVEAEE